MMLHFPALILPKSFWVLSFVPLFVKLTHNVKGIMSKKLKNDKNGDMRFCFDSRFWAALP